VRVNVASGRGLLAGWLIAMTIPLLIDPRSITAWSAAGLGDAYRITLAAIEVAGAMLFAFERVALAGFALLLASFIPAAIIHIHHDEAPWRLALYSVAAILLSLYTLRAQRADSPRDR
jgi:hypothetical protein